MPRGRLRVYLGAAPGVGKTHAMLAEAHRRAQRRSDVVIGVVEDHGRPGVRALAKGLETLQAGPDTLDVAAVLHRRPRVVLVDDLARTNAAGARHEHRWEDVEELLAAGIDVISAVDVGEIASLRDVAEVITAVSTSATVPDTVLRAADQVELVDMTPEALLRRLAHGNICPPEEMDAALSSHFRPSALAALRELALLWLASAVDEGLRRDRREHGGSVVWEVRERVVVALSGGPESLAVLQRGARLTARIPGADLLAVHVIGREHPPRSDAAELDRLREHAEALGAGYHQVIGSDVAHALLEFATGENATQLLVGASRRQPWQLLLGQRGVAAKALDLARDVDVHVVTGAQSVLRRRLPPRAGRLPRPRRLLGFAAAVVLPLALTLGLQAMPQPPGLTSEVLLFLLAVVVTSLVGGLGPALLSAVTGSTCINYFFIPPVHTFWVNERNNVFALVVFVAVAALVSAVVHTSAQRSAQAARAAAESRTLSAIAGSVLRGKEALPALLETVRAAFGMTSVTMLERERGHDQGWVRTESVGEQPSTRPEDADAAVPVGPGLVLALRGRTLAAEDRKVLAAFAAQARVLLEQARLARAADVAARLAATERLRDALLAAVGHDLRTPLASAKAAVTSLRASDVTWSDDERAELLATAEESLDRLGRLVADLLDLSRLRAGALAVVEQPVGLDEAVAQALDELGPAAREVYVSVPPEVPAVRADAALLARVIVNLTANALRYSPSGRPPALLASALGDRVELRVVDRGPGIPATDRDRVFIPFQRLGDTDNTTGLGLGLALSRGLTEAMGGTLEPEDTPGGGLTMVLVLQAADGAQSEGGHAEPGLRERAPDAALRTPDAAARSSEEGE